MRVLITPDWYPWPEQPVFGVFCREHARAVGRIADVAILTWRFDPDLRVPFRLEAANEDGLCTFRVRFARTRVPRSSVAFKLAGSLRALVDLRRRGWTPDVVHAHEYGAAPVALSLGALARAPVIFSEHYSGFSALSGRERRRAKWAFERATLVCPVSQELSGHVQAVAPRAKLEPIPNVVDTEVFVAGADRPGDPPSRLITVASLIERKGHRHLITAVARLRQVGHSLTLELIGDGPLRAELEQLVHDLGLGDFVIFRGAMEKTAIAAALRRADVFVLPSLWENLPCVLLEALSAGLPVVATHVGGVPELVKSSDGILVAPDSADALVEGLSEMVRSGARYDREQLRAKAVSGYGYDAIADRWANVYARVTDSSPTP